MGWLICGWIYMWAGNSVSKKGELTRSWAYAPKSKYFDKVWILVRFWMSLLGTWENHKPFKMLCIKLWLRYNDSLKECLTYTFIYTITYIQYLTYRTKPGILWVSHESSTFFIPKFATRQVTKEGKNFSVCSTKLMILLLSILTRAHIIG